MRILMNFFISIVVALILVPVSWTAYLGQRMHFAVQERTAFRCPAFLGYAVKETRSCFLDSVSWTAYAFRCPRKDSISLSSISWIRCQRNSFLFLGQRILDSVCISLSKKGQHFAVQHFLDTLSKKLVPVSWTAYLGQRMHFAVQHFLDTLSKKLVPVSWTAYLGQRMHFAVQERTAFLCPVFLGYAVKETRSCFLDSVSWTAYAFRCPRKDSISLSSTSWIRCPRNSFLFLGQRILDSVCISLSKKGQHFAVQHFLDTLSKELVPVSWTAYLGQRMHFAVQERTAFRCPAFLGYAVKETRSCFLDSVSWTAYAFRCPRKDSISLSSISWIRCPRNSFLFLGQRMHFAVQHFLDTLSKKLVPVSWTAYLGQRMHFAVQERTAFRCPVFLGYAVQETRSCFLDSVSWTAYAFRCPRKDSISLSSISEENLFAVQKKTSEIG
ncbi:hypothetical protein QYM36_000371 [Artemia franciscana]|uniref:Uncharacterized protein n=1 Tax=Artemia franciscana TaxID=6661 RepID=A0AA88IEN2_ARTSF|nr:hypothetical protein QYM36_000371 [Artemia franciscana]